MRVPWYRKLGATLRPNVRRLADGTPVRLGLRVVKLREPMEAGGLGHGWDDKVHVITSLLSDRTTMVALGPGQVHVDYLAAAPEGGEQCQACARWPETLRRLQGLGGERG